MRDASDVRRVAAIAGVAAVAIVAVLVGKHPFFAAAAQKVPAPVGAP
jgi:xanthine/uracil permease